MMIKRMKSTTEPREQLGTNGSQADDIQSIVRGDLLSVYEEVMWLAKRSDMSASMARAWYTHVRAHRLSKHIRRFTGKVSMTAAANETVPLRLEHFKRIQTTLTQLVRRHVEARRQDAEEFIRVVLDCEQVHIVTFGENYDAMKAKGDYTNAGIVLLDWSAIKSERQQSLWKKMLVGRVANAAAFAPGAADTVLSATGRRRRV